jgi:hypothetical protein
MEQAQQMKKLLETQEGRRLISLLSGDGKSIQAAGQALKQGNTQQAQNIMAPLMEDPEVQRLLKSLEKTLNRG